MIYPRRVRAQVHLQAADRGGSAAQLIRGDDGNNYYAKFKENPQGKRVLVNELVAGGLALQLGVTCAEGVLFDVNAAFLSAATGLANFSGGPISVGTHWAARDLGQTYVSPPADLLSKVSNKDDLASVIVFDALTQNTDRDNAGNYLLIDDSKELRFFAIDHGSCFGSPHWDEDIRERIGSWEPNIIPEVANLIAGSEPFSKSIRKAEAITRGIIDQLLEVIPAEWDVTSGERAALADYIDGQKTCLGSLLEKERGRFPLWKRRR